MVHQTALFDFDGTLTRHDSLLCFVVFTSGFWRLFCHFPQLVWILVSWKVGRFSAKQSKERILALFYQGWTREQMQHAGKIFAEHLLLKGFRPRALETIQQSRQKGIQTVLVTASAEEWVQPIAAHLGIEAICTRLAYDASNHFTGRFAGENCNGLEKSRLIHARFPNLEKKHIEVYGDSEGDFSMFTMAEDQHVHYKPFQSWQQSIFELARPQQWIKNGFVFLPAFFSGRIAESSAFLLSILCFIAFSCCASAIYMLNDLKDCNEDKNHPTKKYRPIARGAVQPWQAITCSIACMIGGLLLSSFLGYICFLCSTTYLFLNIFYVVKGKQTALLDIVCVALGYVLRVLAAMFAINAGMSHWLILMVFLLSMFLAIGKRWDDLSKMEQQKVTGIIRPSLMGYSKNFVIAGLTFLSAINTVCYILYSMDPAVNNRLNTNWLFLTSFWVIIGNLRYLQLLMVRDKGLSPTKILLRDIGIQLCVMCWSIQLLFLIY